MAFVFLVIYLLVFLVRPHEWGNNSAEISIIQYVLILALGLFIFHKNKNLTAPQMPLMILLVLAIFLSVLLSVGWLTGAADRVVRFISYAFVPFMLISALVDTRKKQYLLFSILGLASLLMVWNGYSQISSETAISFLGVPAYDREMLRITYLGYLSDPNDLGMYFVMTLPIMFLFYQKVPAVLRFLPLLAVVLILYGIYLTNSRGTLLAALALFAFWFWQRYKLAKSLFAGAIISPLLLLVTSNFRAISADDASAESRLSAWYEGYQMLQSNPLFGIGQGMFTDHYRRTAHNSFVLAFAELGLVGCLIWVGLLVVSILGLHNIIKAGKDTEIEQLNPDQRVAIVEESRIATALFYSMLAFVGAGFFLSRTYVPLLYLFVGMAAANAYRARQVLPPHIVVYDLKTAAKWTFAIVIGGVIGINLLLRFFS